VGANIETEKDLTKELTKMGYSKNAINQILKWVPGTEN
jgi:SOS response regulatory protein OraA/RecX